VSKAQRDLKYKGPGTTELAKKIRKASALLSTHVSQMTFDLKSFVSNLKTAQAAAEKERTQVAVEKERSLAERILWWLKSLFKAIATIFATFSPSTSGTHRHHPDPKVRGGALADTALGQAASEFCTMDSGAFLKHIILLLQDVIDSLMGKVSESLDPVIQFLEGIVPNEVENAQTKLERLDTHLEIMERMNTGRVNLYGSDPAAIAEEWRDVAEQYQSALERKKSCVIQNTKLLQGFC
jgi:hypothetical protein